VRESSLNAAIMYTSSPQQMLPVCRFRTDPDANFTSSLYAVLMVLIRRALLQVRACSAAHLAHWCCIRRFCFRIRKDPLKHHHLVGRLDVNGFEESMWVREFPWTGYRVRAMW